MPAQWRYNCSIAAPSPLPARPWFPLLALLLAGGTARSDTLEASPPRPALTPEWTEVADLGRNAALPEALQPLFRPAPASWTSGSGAAAPGPGQPLRLTYPLAQRATEIDPFGWRFSPARGQWRMHAGQDLIVPEGTPVLAALPGRVELVETISGYGLTVVIDHGRGWQTLYAHLRDVAVLPGAAVGAGEPLGRAGSSGSASTAHLHFELRRLRQGRLMAVDPGPLLRAPLGTMTKPGIGSVHPR